MKKVCILSLLVGSVLSLPLPVLAEEAKTLPQLDANLYPGQLFWLAICFPLLYVLMHFFVVPRMQRAQANRQNVLKADLDAAEKASEQARAMQTSYEKALAEARAKAHATVNEIAIAAEKEATAQMETQQKDLNKRVAEAESKIDAQREAALKDAKNSAADLAGIIIEKIAGLKISGVSR
jgi:F-type H+-transporting ATPase subunit b